MAGSTPLSTKQIPDIEHISQLLMMKKNQPSKSPSKTYKSEIIQTDEIKKESIKLCLNCENFIPSKSILNH